jgi:phosphatidylserine decarboxylase
MIWALSAAVIVIFAVFAALIVFFNRSPAREIPVSKCIVSPADGKIVEVIDLLEINKKGCRLYGKKTVKRVRELANDTAKHGYMIIIRMGILDVHRQRSPLEGKVLHVKGHKGKHKAVKGAAALWNEMSEILIRGEVGKIKVLQIAGMLARSLVTEAKKGENILKGQHIGRIRLGSHVALVMPDYHLEVRKGDSVLAGETVIAYYGDGA